MKKQTIAPAQQAGFSTLEMWLNRENKLFTELFAGKGESITNRKMLLDMQLIPLIVLLTFNFVNPLMTLICALWFGSAALLVKKYDDNDIQKGGTK